VRFIREKVRRRREESRDGADIWKEECGRRVEGGLQIALTGGEGQRERLTLRARVRVCAVVSSTIYANDGAAARRIMGRGRWLRSRRTTRLLGGNTGR
jgi:hypothetical protein